MSNTINANQRPPSSFAPSGHRPSRGRQRLNRRARWLVTVFVCLYFLLMAVGMLQKI